MDPSSADKSHSPHKFQLNICKGRTGVYIFISVSGARTGLYRGEWKLRQLLHLGLAHK